MGLTDDQRQNMTWRVEQGHAGRLEHRLQPPDIALLSRALLRMGSDVLHSREGTRGQMRAKRGCEDEAVREAADDVDQQRGPGDIAAHHPEGLGERSLDERHPMRHAIALRDAAAAHAVETDRVDLVEIGDGAVLFGDVADRRDRSHIAVHAVDAFKGHDLGAIGRDRAQLFIEMGGVVMAEDKALCSRPADPFDHRIMVERVREDRAARHELAQRAECGKVGNPSRCEDQRCVLAVKVGELGFKLDMLSVGPGDIPRPSRSGSRQIDGTVHGRQYVRMLAHAEIVIAAPDSDAATLAIRTMPQGGWELPRYPLEFDEGPIPAIQLHLADKTFELGDIVHTSISRQASLPRSR